jgi:hypothetical protein
MRTLRELLVMQYQHNPSNATGADGCLMALLLLPVTLIVRAPR